VLERLEVFFVCVAPAGEKQDVPARLALWLRPIDVPDLVAVGRSPAAFAGAGWNGATIRSLRPALLRLANTSLLRLVTF
jgi:hypothetical protein